VNRKEALGKLVTFRTGKLNSNAATADGAYPFFTCAQETYRTRTYAFDTECVLLAGNNANGVYPIKYFAGRFDAYQRTYVIEPIDQQTLLTRYLFYALQLQLEHLRSISTGAATKFLTLTLLNGIEVALPPLHEQKRITSILCAYDDLIENNTRRIAILEEMARRIYEEWFVRFRFPGHEGVRMVDSELGRVPSGFVVECLSNLTSTLCRGPTLTYVETGGVTVLNQRCIRGGEIEVDAIKRAAPLSGNKSHLYLKLSDILINSMGTGTLGRVSRNLSIVEQMIVHNCITLVRVDPAKCSQAYLYYALSSLESHFEAIAVGATGQTSLPITQLQRQQVVVPPQDLLAMFDAAVSQMWSQAGVLKRINMNLRATRDLLLPKLISGELDVSAMPKPLALAA